MTKPDKVAAGGDIGARLAFVSEMLDRAVAVLNETLEEIKTKEQEGDAGGRPGHKPGDR